MRPLRTLRTLAPPGLALVLLAFSISRASAGPSAHTESSPLGLSAVTAEFVQSEFATHYTVEAVDLSGTPKYSWKLALELVDRPGATNPATAGSAAAVDSGCTNNLFGLSADHTSHSPEFTWHHPDPADSIPPGRYHCNHQREGPSGHQGDITVTVTQGPWVCTASYEGTNSGKGKAADCRKETGSGTSTPPTVKPHPPGPDLIPLHGSPVDGPIETAKKAAAADAQDNLQIAKQGGLLAFIPGFKEEKRLTGLAAGTESATALGVSKSLKIVKDVAETIGEATSVVFYVGAYVETGWANDPPDGRYKTVARLKVVTIPDVRPGAQVSAALAVALNRLVANDVMFCANLQAMTTSFERAQGALAARSAAFESLQTRWASRFAQRASALVAAQPKLEQQILLALSATEPAISIHIPARLVGAFAAAERSQGPPARFLRNLGRFGFTSKQSLSAWTLFANTTSTTDLTFAVLFHSPSAVTSEVAFARSLRGAAAAFAKISVLSAAPIAG